MKKHNIYLRKPQEWKCYWWAECVGIFEIQNFSKEDTHFNKVESSVLETKLKILSV